MNTSKFILFLLILLFALSCQNAPKYEVQIIKLNDSESIKNVKRNGHLEFSYHLIHDSILNGKTTTFWDNDTTEWVHFYDHGKPIGWSYSYYKNGILDEKHYILDGKTFGNHYYYSTNGKLRLYAFEGLDSTAFKIFYNDKNGAAKSTSGCPIYVVLNKSVVQLGGKVKLNAYFPDRNLIDGDIKYQNNDFFKIDTSEIRISNDKYINWLYVELTPVKKGVCDLNFEYSSQSLGKHQCKATITIE